MTDLSVSRYMRRQIEFFAFNSVWYYIFYLYFINPNHFDVEMRVVCNVKNSSNKKIVSKSFTISTMYCYHLKWCSFPTPNRLYLKKKKCLNWITYLRFYAYHVVIKVIHWIVIKNLISNGFCFLLTLHQYFYLQYLRTIKKEIVRCTVFFLFISRIFTGYY